MAGRRDQIRMTVDELHRFAREQRIVQVATVGPKGRPHLVPLWYLVPDGDTPGGDGNALATPDTAPVLHAWTFAKSQKAVNLRRDPHATISIDDGVRYEELRGATMECDVELIDDTDRVAEFGLALFARYGDGDRVTEETRAAVLAQAPKRVALRFHPTKVVTWDHRKLGGVY